MQTVSCQALAEYLTETDTDAENASLPHMRRWLWHCKPRHCLKYYSAAAFLPEVGRKTRPTTSASQKSSHQHWKLEETPKLEIDRGLYERGPGAFCVGAVGAGRGPGRALDLGTDIFVDGSAEEDAWDRARGNGVKSWQMTCHKQSSLCNLGRPGDARVFEITGDVCWLHDRWESSSIGPIMFVKNPAFLATAQCST